MSPSTTVFSISQMSCWRCILYTRILIIWVMFLFTTVSNWSFLSWIIGNSDLKYESSCLKPTSRVFICLNLWLSNRHGRKRWAPLPPVGFLSSSMSSSSSNTLMWDSVYDPVTIPFHCILSLCKITPVSQVLVGIFLPPEYSYMRQKYDAVHQTFSIVKLCQAPKKLIDNILRWLQGQLRLRSNPLIFHCPLWLGNELVSPYK